MHAVGLRGGDEKVFGAVLHPALNIQQDKVKKALDIASSGKVATPKLWLSDRVTLATSRPCFSTPILEEALHNLLPKPWLPTLASLSRRRGMLPGRQLAQPVSPAARSTALSSQTSPDPIVSRFHFANYSWHFL